MNPLTNTRNITKLSQKELSLRSGKSSWHDEYRSSAWIFIGGLPYDLTEGDIIAIFSQYGEIVNVNLVRDKITGKQKGFAFICYEDQRSTVLAVDNFNEIKILGRTIRVDHVKDYKAPKDSDKQDEETRKLMAEGCAPERVTAPEKDSDDDFLLNYKPDPSLKQIKLEPADRDERKKDKESKKSKKSKKKKSKKSKLKKKSKRKDKSTNSSSGSDDEDSDLPKKKMRKK